MESNCFGPLAELEPVLQALTQSVLKIAEVIRGTSLKTYKQALLQPTKPRDHVEKPIERSFWRKYDSRDDHPSRPARSEIVKLKLEEFRRLSSPIKPLCFRCGDRGHLASQCRNAVLCFACNRLGHRSSRCRAVIELPEKPHDSHLPDQIATPPPDLTSSTPPPSHSDPFSSQDQGQVMLYPHSQTKQMPDPHGKIKRLVTELAEIKQELELMKKKSSEMEMAMACINAQFLRSQSSAIEEGKSREDQIDNDVKEIQSESISEGRDVAILPTGIGFEVNQGVVEDGRRDTPHGGSLHPRRSLRLRVHWDNGVIGIANSPFRMLVDSVAD